VQCNGKRVLDKLVQFCFGLGFGFSVYKMQISLLIVKVRLCQGHCSTPMQGIDHKISSAITFVLKM
jgi:hypothetical protein